MPSRSYFHQIKVLTLQAFCLRLSLKNTNHPSVWNYNNDSESSCLFYTKKHPVSTHHIRLLSKRNIIFHLDIQGLLPEVFSHKPSLSSSHKPELHLLPSSIRRKHMPPHLDKVLRLPGSWLPCSASGTEAWNTPISVPRSFLQYRLLPNDTDHG